MKRLFAISLISAVLIGTSVGGTFSELFINQTAEAAVSVKGYYRKDGTYVKPHMRSSPDGNPYNNWSFPGNTNPYTGKTAPGNASTYLNNYYNGGSSYTPSYIPSYSPPSISTPTWHSCIEHGIGASYSYLSNKCECSYGYVVRNNKCVSEDNACKEDYGYNARSTFSGKCECGYGYKFNHAGTACISRDKYCQEIDFNAEYDILEDSCVCKSGYKVGASGTTCVKEFDYEPYYYVPPPVTNIRKTYSSSSSSYSKCGENMHENRGGCVCDMGYRPNGGSCIFDTCPPGYTVNYSGVCELRPASMTESVNCISRSPCKCPAGYDPMGNRKCVPR